MTEHREFVRQLSTWLSSVGVTDADERAEVAVDLADLLRAAEVVRLELSKLLAPHPAAVTTDDTLQAVANIEVQLFTELKWHLESLETRWQRVVETVAKHSDTAATDLSEE